MLNYMARYFTLNRRERNGILALITLLLCFIVIKFAVVHFYETSATVSLIELDSTAARLSVQEIFTQPEKEKGNFTFQKNRKDSLFYFDPNTVSFNQAMQLGFDKKCANMLMNYRDKGGKFYKAADLQKLYCMDAKLFAQLEPYIVVGQAKEEEYSKEKYSEKKESKQSAIEINSADSMDWMKLKGIGPGYTRRILKYKSLLGGFTSIEQIREVYNFPDSLYQSIKGSLTVNTSFVQKLKVNTVDFKTMVHHPYIKYEGTKCIFALKRGKNIKEEDLTNSSCFSREQLQKLLPYLDFE
jgi:competence protein ComEA